METTVLPANTLSWQVLLGLGVVSLALWLGRLGARLLGQAARLTTTQGDDRYWRILGLAWWGVTLLGGLSLLTEIFRVPLEPLRTWGNQLSQWLGSRGFTGLLILASAAFAHRLIPRLLGRVPVVASTEFTRQQVRIQTLRAVLDSGLRTVVLVIGGLFFLSNLGLNVTALLAGVGVAGLAVSFAAQNLIRDLINGFFILLEDQFGVGDVITVGALSGTVERFNLRITVLRDLEGRVHFLPNSGLAVVTVSSRDWARAVVDVPVSWKEDLERALAVFRDEVERFYQDPLWGPKFSGPPDIQGVQGLANEAITLRVLFTTKPKEQWEVGREFRRRIAERFGREAIKTPATQ